VGELKNSILHSTSATDGEILLLLIRVRHFEIIRRCFQAVLYTPLSE